jgi:hypothetical protein
MPNIRISVTVPDASKFSSRKFVDSILDKMSSKTAPEIKRVFESTVSTWSHKVDFSSKVESSSEKISTTVFAGGQNADLYKLVSSGSPSHRISAKKGGLLKFYTGYRSSTLPRVLLSRQSMRGGNIEMAKSVNHPGFEAREFPEALKEFYEDTFEKDMQDAMDEAAKS